MNFYFVSLYNPKGEKRECFGLFELEQYNNEHYLKWHFGESDLTRFCLKINKHVVENNLYYIRETLLGEHYTKGFPFKSHYFNCCVNKEDVYGYLFCCDHKW